MFFSLEPVRHDILARRAKVMQLEEKVQSLEGENNELEEKVQSLEEKLAQFLPAGAAERYIIPKIYYLISVI